MYQALVLKTLRLDSRTYTPNLKLKVNIQNNLFTALLVILKSEKSFTRYFCLKQNQMLTLEMEWIME